MTPDPLIDLKHCPSCDRSLAPDAFSRDSRMKDGRRFYCRECVSAKAKAAYREQSSRRAIHGPCACIRWCGDVWEDEDDPRMPVCKGLPIKKMPLVEIVMVAR